jgi:hypothetical protein
MECRVGSELDELVIRGQQLFFITIVVSLIHSQQIKSYKYDITFCDIIRTTCPRIKYYPGAVTNCNHVFKCMTFEFKIKNAKGKNK